MTARITLLDGGMGRELKRMGAPFRQPEWSALALIEAPETVARAHAAFIAAGAEVIITNSYALVPFHIGEARFAKDETLGSIAEAEAVADALGDDRRPLWISYTLADEKPDPEVPRLRSGEPVAEALRAAVRCGAKAVLFNCSQPEVMAPALAGAREILAALGAEIPFGAYANTFPPKDESAQANEESSDLRDDLDPAGYLGFARDWAAGGATIIGGCCGIGPDHIAALRVEFGGP
jgi:homocysteine S-methyltransferase